jgi:hypothetical protein
MRRGEREREGKKTREWNCRRKGRERKKRDLFQRGSFKVKTEKIDRKTTQLSLKSGKKKEKEGSSE